MLLKIQYFIQKFVIFFVLIFFILIFFQLLILFYYIYILKFSLVKHFIHYNAKLSKINIFKYKFKQIQNYFKNNFIQFKI